MNLLLTVPSDVLVDTPISKLLAETTSGSFCLLPRHADTAAVLVPGLLTYVATDGNERVVAVDHGLLVKVGASVRVSCQRAVLAPDLASAEAAVRERFRLKDAGEKRSLKALLRLEADILRRLSGLRG